MTAWNLACEEWLDETLPQILPVRKRKMFGYPAWFEYDRMRLCLTEEGVGIKSDPGVIKSAKDSGVPLTEFVPLGRPAGRSWALFLLPSMLESWDSEGLRFALGLLLSVPAPEKAAGNGRNR